MSEIWWKRVEKSGGLRYNIRAEMKILDRYVAKSFLIGYLIAFCVLIGLTIIIDLFVNLDEFTEQTEYGSSAVIRNVLSYYGAHITLYFRDFAGMITVVAAVFSLGKMVRHNELVAVMSSGVSLKRVIAPIIILALGLTGLLVIDQEFLIPRLADKLVRKHDTMVGKESYDVWFLSDRSGSLICSRRFDVETSTLEEPTILLRTKKADSLEWIVTGWISAEKAVFNFDTERWDFVNGRLGTLNSPKGPQPIDSYSSDVTPREIPVRRHSLHKTLLSSKQLAVLASRGTKIKDLTQLHSQKHFRITDPIINLVMLLISLPVLVCRDPKAMKSAIMFSFGMTALCFVTTFLCKLLATEYVFNRVMPELWAWLPVFIFLPIAFVELDSMKT